MSACSSRRDLLDLFRYGEAEAPVSDDSVRHLERCGSCRLEIGLDRALVRELRRALAERVDGGDPSPAVWAAIRREAEVPHVGWRTRWMASLTMLARGAGGAVAVSTLAFALVVFGGQRDLPLPPHADAPVAPQLDAARPFDAAEAAGSRHVPAERIHAPTLPSPVGVEPEVLGATEAKRPLPEPMPEEPQYDAVTVAASLPWPLQTEEPYVVVASSSAAEPEPSAPPMANPI